MKPFTYRPRKRVFLYLFFSLLAGWLLGDFVYSRITMRRVRQWEATLQYDADGIREGCREYTIGEGSDALLLVHGFNDSPACYYRMAPELAKQGFTCRAMRLPGFGMSTADYADCGHQDWLTAINEEVAQLRRQHDRVSIVAHSMGGALAIRAVLDHPDQVDAVVLIAPAVSVNDQRSPLLSARAWHRLGDRLLLFTRVIENVFPLDAHADDANRYPWQTRFVPRRATTEFFQVVESVQNTAAEFKTPMMMVLSKEDLVVDWQAAKLFYDQAASQPKEIHFVEDAGHVIPFDNGWEALVPKIARFVRDVNAAK